MNSKTLVALVGTLAFGTVSIAHADDKAAPAPSKPDAKKGDTKKDPPKKEEDKKGGSHSCSGQNGCNKKP